MRSNYTVYRSGTSLEHFFALFQMSRSVRGSFSAVGHVRVPLDGALARARAGGGAVRPVLGVVLVAGGVGAARVL